MCLSKSSDFCDYDNEHSAFSKTINFSICQWTTILSRRSLYRTLTFRQPFTAEIRVLFLFSLYWRTGFHPSTPVFPVNATPSTPHTHSLIYFRRYVIVSSDVIIKRRRRHLLDALSPLPFCVSSFFAYVAPIDFVSFVSSFTYLSKITHTHTHTHRVVHSRSTHFRAPFSSRKGVGVRLCSPRKMWLSF
jgi:hypothetical protein